MSLEPFGYIPLSFLAWAAQMVAFHGIGYAFEWCDSTGRLKRFKVRELDRMSYRQLLPRVLFNQTAILLPSMLAVEYFGLGFVGAPHLSWTALVLTMIGMLIGHDIVQYVAHRHLLHHPAMMNRLGHALHHQTGASKAISACYQSGADFFFEIVLPYLLPLVLVGGGGASVAFHLWMTSLGALGGLYEHSGYDFGLAFRDPAAKGWRKRLNAALDRLTSSTAHGFHHTRGNVSFSDGFGTPGICDTLFKTRWDLAPERVRQRERAAATSA
ncbi:sterol desaturase family protein [Methylosinus sp. PW1]|uniref:sterol desaturase family protein n=1 Tax=Methylosinus sp. PW1 TaxID=107636 RepID=UPI000564F948|nr:sterol desaturase family protein [Methylosinus sp. PW1]